MHHGSMDTYYIHAETYEREMPNVVRQWWKSKGKNIVIMIAVTIFERK